MSTAEIHAALLRAVVDREGPVVPDRASWDRWTFTAQMERVVPLLYRLVDIVATDLTDEQRDEIRMLQGQTLSRCVQLEHHALTVVGRLAAVGIPSLVLKGLATAHLDYPDPAWREFRDVDMLIHSSDRATALAILGSDGWMQGYALPRGHEQFTHAVTLVKDETELDLHQRVAHRALGMLVPTSELFESAVRFEIAGSSVRALGHDDRLVHAALHAVSSRGEYRHLSSVADVLLLAARAVDHAQDVLARAERWRVRSLVERAVRDAYATAQLAVPQSWMDAMHRPIRRRDALVDRAYSGARRRPVLEELAYLRLLDRWADRGRYVAGYLVPGRHYIEAHGRARARDHWQHLVDKVRSRRSVPPAPWQ